MSFTTFLWICLGLLALGIFCTLGWMQFKLHWGMHKGLPREVYTRDGTLFIQEVGTPGRYVPFKDPPRHHGQLPSYHALGITWKELWGLLKPDDQKRWDKLKPQ